MTDTPLDLETLPPGVDPRAVLTRGWQFHREGKTQEARMIYAQVLRWQPDNADALHLLGIAEAQLGNLDAAADLMTQSIKADPGKPETHFHLGNAMRAMNHPQEALICYNQVITLDPQHAGALGNRAQLLFQLKRYDAALASYDRAAALAPGNSDIERQRTEVLFALERYQEALAGYEADLEGNPVREESLIGRVNCLMALQRFGEGIAASERLLDIHPDSHNALGALYHMKMSASDWTDTDRILAQMLTAVRAGKSVSAPFMVAVSSPSAEDGLLAARIEDRHNNFPALPAPLWQGERYKHDKIRVAYVSADFSYHATTFLMNGVFAHHDRNRFEISAVSYAQAADQGTRAKLMHSFDRFVDVAGGDDEKIATLMREMEIDIAIDLKGYTRGYRPKILSRRPAPIQVNYLAYPGTMGADYIDYLIADPTIVPQDDQRYYSEKIVYLPHCYQANDDKRPISDEPLTRAAVGLPDGGFVFCSFNKNYKITPDVYDVWMRLLKAVPGSMLWIMADGTDAVRNLKRETEARGVSSDRLVFARLAAIEHHLARHRLADMFLDTLPCNAHTTASDALWAGLPVLTCLGHTFAGRVAGSIVRAVGLPELATESMADYEAMALKLAREPQFLAAIKARLAANRLTYPLFDTARFTRHLEAAYTVMWERHQRGDVPESFSVPAEPSGA